MKRLTTILFLSALSFMAPQAKGNQAPTPQSSSRNLCEPPAVVASFLGFTQTQAAQFADLLNQIETTLHGLQEQIAGRQAQLDALLSQPNPNPAIIGSLFLQIHALQQQVTHAIQSYQDQFAALLTDEQKQKIQAVTLASQLQPAVEAFVALYLVPAPTPLPCQKR